MASHSVADSPCARKWKFQTNHPINPLLSFRRPVDLAGLFHKHLTDLSIGIFYFTIHTNTHTRAILVLDYPLYFTLLS